MRKFYSVFFFIFLLSKLFAGNGAVLRIASYDIRNQTPVDSGAHSWQLRRVDLTTIINTYDFDLLGIQSITTKTQENDLNRHLPEYSFFGKGIDSQDGRKGEQLGMYFRKSRFEILKSGFFFLSGTPETMSIGWDAAERHICVWTKMHDKINKVDFFVFVTKFDRAGARSRVHCANLICSKIKEIAKESPVVLLGNLNAPPTDQEMYQTLTAYMMDSKVYSIQHFEPSIGTYNEYDMTNNIFPAELQYDYIFSRKSQIYTYRVITDRVRPEYFPSDHFPVMIECIF